jgi:hypothetical protein
MQEVFHSATRFSLIEAPSYRKPVTVPLASSWLCRFTNLLECAEAYGTLIGLRRSSSITEFVIVLVLLLLSWLFSVLICVDLVSSNFYHISIGMGLISTHFRTILTM